MTTDAPKPAADEEEDSFENIIQARIQEESRTADPTAYHPRVHDLLLSYSIVNTHPVHHLYTVSSILVGSTNEEGVVELEPVNHTPTFIFDGDKKADLHTRQTNPYVPILMLERMVDAGIVTCLWRIGVTGVHRSTR